MAFRTVIEPHDTSVAFAMPDEVEVTIRQQVCDRFRDRSQKRLNRLFAVDTSHMNVPRVVCRKRRMTRSVRQESVERDQRGLLPGLSILNGRERNLTKRSCPLRNRRCSSKGVPGTWLQRSGHLSQRFQGRLCAFTEPCTRRRRHRSGSTAEKVAQTAIGKFGSIDHVVNNAGIFSAKPFTDYTAEEFRGLVSTNLERFIFITQLAVKQMLSQGTGGSVTSITASLADNPIAGVPASIVMITKGGLDAITVSLASEYAKSNIRFNAVAPGVVDTPLHKSNPKEFLKTPSPMGTISEARDIADAVVYLTEARRVTGEVLHVDGGAHVGRW
jgi:NAD(P)-dependent dehydrogenase (short-subunit alcohol dehydrogenase family)